MPPDPADSLVLRDDAGFAVASRAVVDYLAATIPLGLWTVSRHDGVRQVYLEINDTAYGMTTGDGPVWEDSLCAQMASGAGPQIAPDAMALPEYADAPVAHDLAIGAYVGIPLRWADGTLFGTLCGIDPAPQGSDLETQEPLLRLLADLLSTVLQAEHALVMSEREVERTTVLAEIDPLTGLLNRRGWDRIMAAEERRHQAFGDPAAIVALDLDGLKGVNDTLGHAAGDDQLRRAAEAMRTAARKDDVVARVGGDEFGILVLGAGAEVIGPLVERLRAALDQVAVPTSIGLAPCLVGTPFEVVWRAADAQMYVDKAARRTGTR